MNVGSRVATRIAPSCSKEVVARMNITELSDESLENHYAQLTVWAAQLVELKASDDDIKSVKQWLADASGELQRRGLIGNK